MGVPSWNGRFQQQMRRAGIFIPLIAVLVFGTAACDALTEPMPDTFVPQSSSVVGGAAPAYTNPVRRGTITQQINLRGRVVAANEAPLFFKNDGWITELNLSLGDQVERGDLLAVMESPTLAREVQDAQYSLDRARLNFDSATKTLAIDRLAIAQVAVDQAEVALERAKLSLAKLIAPPTQDEIDAAKLAVERAKNSLWATQSDRDGVKGNPWAAEYQGISGDARVAVAENSVTEALLNLQIKLSGPKPEDVALAQNAVVGAEANLNAAKANLEYEQVSKDRSLASMELNIASLGMEVSYREQLLRMAGQRLGDTKLVAPFSGSIVSLDAKVGGSVKPFAPIGVLADPSQLQVETNIPAEQVDSVAVGMAAKVTLDGVQEKTFSGKITSISDKAITWQGQNVYRATIAFDKDAAVPGTMRIGADITLAGQTKNNVLIVPAGSVSRDGDRRYTQLVVGGKARRVEVKVGASTADWVEIVSGLQDGDQVGAPASNNIQTIAR